MGFSPCGLLPYFLSQLLKSLVAKACAYGDADRGFRNSHEDVPGIYYLLLSKQAG
jgi:hypothetical protein